MNEVNPNNLLRPMLWRNLGFAGYGKDGNYDER